MRGIALAVGGLLTLGPAVARAQVAGPYAPLPTEYTLSGCLDGIVRYDGSGFAAVPVFGRVACFGGTARFEVAQVAGSASRFLQATGILTAAFDQGFSGTSIQADAFSSFVRFTYSGATFPNGDPCPSGVCGASLDVFPSLTPLFRVGGAGLTFRTVTALFPSTADLTSIRDASARFSFNYLLPNAPDGGQNAASATPSFTPTVVPEPATVVLVAAGLGAVAAATARQRRAAAA